MFAEHCQRVCSPDWEVRAVLEEMTSEPSAEGQGGSPLARSEDGGLRVRKGENPPSGRNTKTRGWHFGRDAGEPADHRPHALRLIRYEMTRSFYEKKAGHMWLWSDEVGMYIRKKVNPGNLTRMERPGRTRPGRPALCQGWCRCWSRRQLGGGSSPKQLRACEADWLIVTGIEVRKWLF